MVKCKFELIDGLTIDNETHKEIEMEELKLGDISAAGQAAEQCQLVEGSVYVVKSSVLLDMELLRRQIKRLGSLTMPLPVEKFELLSRTDLVLIQQKAAELDKAMYIKVLNWGRSEPESSGKLPVTEPGAEQ